MRVELVLWPPTGAFLRSNFHLFPSVSSSRLRAAPHLPSDRFNLWVINRLTGKINVPDRIDRCFYGLNTAVYTKLQRHVMAFARPQSGNSTGLPFDAAIVRVIRPRFNSGYVSIGQSTCVLPHRQVGQFIQ